MVPRVLRPGSPVRWSSPSSPTVVPGLLAEAVESLPHDRATTQTTLDRIKAGWARILADVKG